jgi:HD-GYP domain-containing protein (c-di-GMP phosphodiesterase class II)
MQLNRNEFVSAFALALDFLESSLRKNVSNHSKRVAFLAVCLGEKLRLSDEDMFDLYACAMLHDNGMTHAVYKKLESGDADSMENSRAHCVIGEENLRTFPFLRPRSGVILYHHEAYNGSGYFGLERDEIPLLAHIIHLADKVEMLYNDGAPPQQMAAQIAAWKGIEFSPLLCDAFAELIAQLSFRLALDDRFIERELARRIPVYRMELSMAELLPISGIISKIIDEKSPFTGMHSQGIAEKSALMADFYRFDPERKTKLIIAAHLHDVGKLAVPNAILDKPKNLTPNEFAQIKPHAFYTRYILESIAGLEDITDWASNHHEKLDGTGYPYGLSEDALCFEAQLMACIDIYQALTENRPYRKALEHAVVAKIMCEMADKHAINRGITNDVLEVGKSFAGQRAALRQVQRPVAP